ncbi:MAG: MFS transporter [Pseudomonadota bacterium]|nr:MFS transporter [Pseudomonadota bacterium]
MSDTQSRLPLALIALATSLALIVFTQPLTTLAVMTADLSLTPGQQAWVMSGMPLGAASGLLTAGAFGDTLGRRRTFVAGLWITAVASIVAALAWSGPMLIVMRIVQGIGSAGIMASGLGLVGQIYRGEAQARAAAVWAAALGSGVALGPIMASLLLPVGGWPAMHWLIAGLSAALALGSARLPESPHTGERVDLRGAALLTVGMACVMAALIEVRVGGAVLVAGLVLVGVLCLGAFLMWERRVRNPILRIDLFRAPAFSGATLAAFASGAGVLALMSMVPIVLEHGMGVSPFHAALILLAWSGVTIFSALGARFLPAALTARQRVILAILGCALGQGLMLMAVTGAGWAVVLPGLFVAGVSNGILNASLGHEAVRTVPEDRAAMGSAMNNTARYLGSALGIALISVLIAGRDGAAFFASWHDAVLVSTGLSLLGVAVMTGVAARHRIAAVLHRS